MTIHRRAFLSASAALVALTISPRPFAWADLDDEVAAAIRAAINGRDVTEGGIETRPSRDRGERRLGAARRDRGKPDDGG